MFLTTICGNLGADAEVKVKDGRQFVTFRVADTRRYQMNGQEVEETQWFSCIMSGDGGELIKYLVKGQQVLVVGNASTRVVSSPKLRRMIAGVDINVRSIELIGRVSNDLVPRRIAAPDGTLIDVYKFYAVDTNLIRPFIGDSPSVTMYDERGHSYTVDKNGWVVPDKPLEDSQADAADEAVQATAEPADDSQANSEPAPTANTKRSKK